MKKILILLILILGIAAFLFYKNVPIMTAAKENDVWDFFVEKDFKDSKYLQGVLSQKNKNDEITVNYLNILDKQNDTTIIAYDADDIKNADIEGYEVNFKPFYLEFPLGNKVEKESSYTLEITYTIKNETYTDKIEFK